MEVKEQIQTEQDAYSLPDTGTVKVLCQMKNIIIGTTERKVFSFVTHMLPQI